MWLKSLGVACRCGWNSTDLKLGCHSGTRLDSRKSVTRSTLARAAPASKDQVSKKSAKANRQHDPAVVRHEQEPTARNKRVVQKAGLIGTRT